MHQLQSLKALEYKMAENPMESVRKLFELNKEGKFGDYRVEEIELPKVVGYDGIAFMIPDLVKEWKGRMREFLMDSACRFAIGSQLEILNIFM